MTQQQTIDTGLVKAAAGEFRFGTKSSTLACLAGRLGHGSLCQQLVVRQPDWRNRSTDVINEILHAFAPQLLAVRSSSTLEDTQHTSNAGAFESIIGVAAEPADLQRAIDGVFASYLDEADGHEVLVQPMVENVALSGVVMTRDLDTGAPYYVINYDDYSGRTDTVTSGGISKTVAVHRTNIDALKSPRMRAVIRAVRELEAVTGSDELDIEFCVTEAVEVYVLQVRPLAAKRNWHMVEDSLIDDAIADIRSALDTRMAPAGGLAGASTILGEMPDWNPAEMIGNTPRPLALSLYKTLITDRIWSDARAYMGYQTVPHPLLVDYAGRPYIDVRLSLNSFLPAGLDQHLASRLVDHQLSLLAANKSLHDKIEFHVAVTCLNLAPEERLSELRSAGFEQDEIDTLTAGLRVVTNAAVAPGSAGLNRLLARTDRFLDSAVSQEAPSLDGVFSLLDAVRQDGTLPFSVLARHGFIAVTLLRSAVTAGIFSEEDADRFMLGIHTVAADLVRDMALVAEDGMDRKAFLARYGHLRPGTYDILSWRYDEKPDLYLGNAPRVADGGAEQPEKFDPTREQRAAMSGELARLGLPDDAGAVLDYITTAIQAREQAKFAFTRGISEALKALGNWGETAGLSREDISYLPVETVAKHRNDPGALREAADAGRENHKLTRAIRLPHLIVEPDDIDIVRAVVGQPTFVTTTSATARNVILQQNDAPSLEGQIVLIESADPGFDWIFSHKISGLVTKYGGANSHMAIRCAEFGLPAAIGCGEKLFAELSKASVIELNCAARRVTGH